MLNRMGIAVIVAVGATLIPPTAAIADDQKPAILTAVRELNRQVNFLQEIYPTDTRLMELNGLWQQTTDFYNAVYDFRAKVTNNASREAIVLGFDVVDSKLNSILDEVRVVEKNDAALRLVCRKLRSSMSDLHFAVFAGDGTPARQSQVLYRQTMSQQAFVESLGNNISWIFSGSQSLAGWQADLATLQQSLVALQRLEKDNAPADQIKQGFGVVDANWGKIMQRYQSATPQNALLLKSFMVLVDQGFARLAPLAGVMNRPVPLSD